MIDRSLPTPQTRFTDAQLATYIAEMCREMRSLSRAPQFRALNYLLDMARIEAERLAKGDR